MDELGMTIAAWVGIALCITQSAMFSGLNLAVFGVSRMRLEVEASSGSAAAAKVLDLRRDSNFVLTTILWGNVAINVLLTLLSDSVLAGVSAFLFSTIAITFLGEITPQAYCSRNALKVTSLLAPALRFYQFILYPVAKPCALLLDAWLGQEGMQFYREKDFRAVIQHHMDSESTTIDRTEGLGALNFLALDDIPVANEGVTIDPQSVLPFPSRDGLPEFPPFERQNDDPFLRQIAASGKPWVVITDEANEPLAVLDADGFLRTALFSSGAATLASTAIDRSW